VVRDDAAERDREDQQREREEEVHQPADDRVDPAAEVAGDDAEHGADDDRQQGRQERDEERDPGAVDHAAEQVAAVQRLQAEQEVLADAVPVADRGRRVDVDEVLVELVRRVTEHLHDQRREDRDEDQDDDEDAATHRDPVPPQSRQRDLTERTACDDGGAAGLRDRLGLSLTGARNVERRGHDRSPSTPVPPSLTLCTRDLAQRPDPRREKLR
jgi:hypothetical protein